MSFERKRKEWKKRKDVDSSLAKQLTRQIKKLKSLPNNFRDIIVGSQDWIDFQELLPEKQKEMEAWSKGTVLCITTPACAEQDFFKQHYNGYIIAPHLKPDTTKVGIWKIMTFRQLAEAVAEAEETNCSWLYLPQFSKLQVQVLNEFLSIFGSSVRVKGQILDSYGYPLGIVY